MDGNGIIFNQILSHTMTKVSSLCTLAIFLTRSLSGQEDTSSLPLPDVTEKNNMLSEWRGGYPLPNSIRSWHYNPDLVRPMAEIGQAVQNETLEYELQMKIAAVVSSRNGCRYCLCSSAKSLNGDGLHDSLMIALQRSDLSGHPFDPKEKNALSLASILTTEPSLSGTSVRAALEAGWTNAEVAQIIFFVSYMNMMNRIAAAFNLPPDASHPYHPGGKLPMIRCP
jgi:alkylhydroperoxidase family enzyme